VTRPTQHHVNLVPESATSVTAEGGEEAQPGTQVVPGQRRRSRGGVGWFAIAERFGLLAVLGALVLVFSLLQPDIFPSAANWQSIVASQSVVLIVALGLMVPLIAGNFDLSVGSVAILSSIVVAGAQQNHHAPLWLACALGVASGVIVGIINGVLITKIRLNALIATLGSSVIIAGLVDAYTGGSSITNGISTSLTNFGNGRLVGISKLAIVAIIASLLVFYTLTKTPYGRRLFAIGSSKPAAELVGIRVDRVVLVSFLISGTLGGIAGVLMLAQQGSGNPAANGISVLLPALAAVYLGASTLYPGEFNVPGTILGLVLVAALVSGLTLEGVAAWVQPVATGAALIVAVGASEAFRRQRR